MPTIILPVETAARELDAKLLLAVFLARAGLGVIIGSHARINNRMHKLNADAYVSQTIVKAKRRLFGIIRARGMRLAAWDEEGMVWPSPEFYRARRLDAENWAMLDRFLAWGGQQAGVIREAFPGAARKLRLSGNPRQDLYTARMARMHDTAVGKIRAEYGRMILINSNFGSLHHARQPHVGLKKTRQDLQRLAAVSRHRVEYLEARYRVFRTFCELLPALAEEFPDHTVLIRPHPSENPAAWEELAAPYANVVVRYDHELIPWLMAAEVVIHNGCTTALEAAMLGTPVIDFRAVETPNWESPQPRAVSIPATSPQEVIGLIRAPERLQQEKAAIEPALREIFHGWGEGLACERITEELLSLLAEPAPSVSSGKKMLAGLKSRVRAVEKSVVGRLMPTKSANPDYIDRKFPPMTVDEARERLGQLAELAGLPAPVIKELGDRIWQVAPADN